MKKILIGIIFSGISCAHADSLCTIFCVKTLSKTLETAKIVEVTPTIYKSKNDRLLSAAIELIEHCAKVSKGSKPISTLSFDPNTGTLNVREIERTEVSVAEMNCTNI